MKLVEDFDVDRNGKMVWMLTLICVHDVEKASMGEKNTRGGILVGSQYFGRDLFDPLGVEVFVLSLSFVTIS